MRQINEIIGVFRKRQKGVVEMMIKLNCTDGHIPIETSEDFQRFLDETNGMHDAYLLSAEYHAHVRANHHTVVLYGEGESLILRYQVTSASDLPIVELTFLDVSEWNAPSGDLFGLSVSFHHPLITVLDGSITLLSDDNIADNVMRVTARKMYWRIVSRPGLNLQRGGTKDAVWYVIPNLWLPMNQNLEDYTQIIEELAATVPNAKLYYMDSSQPFSFTEADFITDHIHSFRSEKTVYAEDGKAFCFHELRDREALKEAVSRLDHGTLQRGNMIAICDDKDVVFTVELIEKGCFNMVICSHRGKLNRFSFCGDKFHTEPYSGGGMDELS